MSNENIREQWEQFVEKYKEHFMSNEEKWEIDLQKVKDYIVQYKKLPSVRDNKLPSVRDNNPEIKRLALWIGCQQNNYRQ